MADEDDIEKLLAEVNQMDAGGSAKPPAKKKGDVSATDDDDDGMSRIAWMLVAGVGSGIIGFLIGLFIFIIPGGAWELGIGAGIGGLITGLISGPPKWLQ